MKHPIFHAGARVPGTVLDKAAGYLPATFIASGEIVAVRQPYEAAEGGDEDSAALHAATCAMTGHPDLIERGGIKACEGVGGNSMGGDNGVGHQPCRGTAHAVFDHPVLLSALPSPCEVGTVAVDYGGDHRCYALRSSGRKEEVDGTREEGVAYCGQRGSVRVPSDKSRENSIAASNVVDNAVGGGQVEKGEYGSFDG